MAHLLADEDFSHLVVAELRLLGHDVVTVRDVGKVNQRWPDADVLFFAIAKDRAVLTKNRRHVYGLHQQHPYHAGILACTEDPDVQGQGRRIHQALIEAVSLRGQFIRIYPPSH